MQERLALALARREGCIPPTTVGCIISRDIRRREGETAAKSRLEGRSGRRSRPERERRHAGGPGKRSRRGGGAVGAAGVAYEGHC